MYKKPNQRMIEHFTERYQQAKTDNALLECAVGCDANYRINTRDSYYTSISDPEVILEYVLYPQYVDGATSVEGEAKKLVEQLANSDRVIDFYQAYSFICAEMMMKKFHGEIPFSVVSETLVQTLKERLPEMADRLKTYNEGEFGKYQSTLYDSIVGIMEASKLF